jgi:isoamylase
MNPDILSGQSFPLGATVYPNGVNFSIFSKHAEVLELLLFDAPERKPNRIIQLNPQLHKTSYYWHVFVPNIKAGQIYAYRAYGPFAPELGYRFDSTKVLLDPYARAVIDDNYSREAAIAPGDNCDRALKGVVVAPSAYNWEGDKPLNIPYAATVIYELHVRGFTCHPNSGVAPAKQGTYAGLIEKIPYLKDLGITAIELMPVQQFDEQGAPPTHTNYWGYSPVAFFAPHRGYSSHQDPLRVVNEFRDLVKALHQAGIEVILDVVFNHTDEGNQNGPTLSFRGLENPAYYILEADRANYANYSGCGNTFNGNHSVVRHLILDCLRYWVSEMHIDGFRFDLASVLSRDESGIPLENPPILWSIESDPVLAGTKIIAEAWDAGGLYQVGTFIGDRFCQWNGPFRDDVRRFVKGDSGTVKTLAARIMGSPDIYPQRDRDPNRSINFVTCHDGFTLNDLVSYNDKHNEANGEDNCDGAKDNFSWNCGSEGKSNDLEIETLRNRQIKNFLTILFIAQGTPMLLMGDEIRRSQLGNNNAYCQDNEVSWFDWSSLDQYADLRNFTKSLICFTQATTIFRQEKILATTTTTIAPQITWHGIRLGQPDWGDDSHSLAFSLHHPECGEYLHVMLNAYWQPLAFDLPPPRQPGDRWCLIVDTALPSSNSFCLPEAASPLEGGKYEVAARASVVLMAR